MAPLEREFYNRKELANLLGVTPLTIYRIAQRGELDYHMVGNSMRFRREDIEKYLASRRNIGLGSSKKGKTIRKKSKR
ncbi:MAG: helix-turn-helix domain-containing protein [Candidatus Omnitrophica bacterium]|nr:helix-turn-helix domain-containing protein [Candidatus Omnitrophota bacterium]